MKKLFLLSILTFASLVLFTACGSRDEGPNTPQEAQDFTNANYIKSVMQGTWKYWGHESPSCSCWVYSGDVYNSYYKFNSDNTYEYKSIFDTSIVPIENGTYSINPVIGGVNASLNLKYTDKGVQKTRVVILKALEGNTVTVYSSSWNERFVKQ